MFCVSCSRPGPAICGSCARKAIRSPPRRIGTSLTVYPAMAHDGVGRSLVHRMKYQGTAGSAEALAALMVSCLPNQARALVPVPRTWARRVRFGIDPGRELAKALARLAALPIVTCLGAPLWVPAHAGRSRNARRRPHFTVRRSAPEGSVLVDDVITTGSTLASAAELLDVQWAVTATSAGI